MQNRSQTPTSSRLSSSRNRGRFLGRSSEASRIEALLDHGQCQTLAQGLGPKHHNGRKLSEQGGVHEKKLPL